MRERAPSTPRARPGSKATCWPCSSAFTRLIRSSRGCRAKRCATRPPPGARRSCSTRRSRRSVSAAWSAGADRLALCARRGTIDPKTAGLRDRLERLIQEAGLAPPDLASLADTLGVPAAAIEPLVRLLARRPGSCGSARCFFTPTRWPRCGGRALPQERVHHCRIGRGRSLDVQAALRTEPEVRDPAPGMARQGAGDEENREKRIVL